MKPAPAPPRPPSAVCPCSAAGPQRRTADRNPGRLRRAPRRGRLRRPEHPRRCAARRCAHRLGPPLLRPQARDGRHAGPAQLGALHAAGHRPPGDGHRRPGAAAGHGRRARRVPGHEVHRVRLLPGRLRPPDPRRHPADRTPPACRRPPHRPAVPPPGPCTGRGTAPGLPHRRRDRRRPRPPRLPDGARGRREDHRRTAGDAARLSGARAGPIRKPARTALVAGPGGEPAFGTRDGPLPYDRERAGTGLPHMHTGRYARFVNLSVRLSCACPSVRRRRRTREVPCPAPLFVSALCARPPAA